MGQTVKYPRYYKQGQSYRLTKEEIKEMKLLRKEGWTLAKIAEKFKVSSAGVRYHTDPDAHKYYLERLRAKSKTEGKEAKRIRQLKDYYRKKQMFGAEFFAYLYTIRKDFPSYKHNLNKYLDKKYASRLSAKELRIIKEFYKIKLKLKSNP